jgi:uncharacterized small protein (DUF1192 family)
MTTNHDHHAARSGWASPTDIQRYLLEARRMRAETLAAGFRWLGSTALRLGRQLRKTLLRERERRAVTAELAGYSDAELEQDLLIPRSEIGRIAAEEADRRVKERSAARPELRNAA